MKESSFLEKMLGFGRKVIPRSLFRAAQPLYHYILAVLGAWIYRFPAKKLVVIGVTGTKGKTTTVELINAILESAGHTTALASTLRYKMADKEQRNLFKMTMRGRFFTQKFLREALDKGCTRAIIEVSSEGVAQSRHKFLYLDALIFTNLAPEHIESHGSYERYVNAKVDIAREMIDSPKNPVLVVNSDDKEAYRFLELPVKNKVPYSLSDPIGVRADERGSSFQIGKIVIHSKLPGIFNIYNMLAAATYAKFAGIPDEAIKNGLESVSVVRGRMEKIDEKQGFDAVVDYAHTPESLQAVYEAYKGYKKIAVLGSTGGGRDKWKREKMGKIADKYCAEIILTNEDPYDEDPWAIVADVKKGIKRKPCEVIMDRREAIRKALEKADDLKLASERLDSAQGPRKDKVAVLITGKGTDPYIMGPRGSKIPWDDATVVREELRKLLKR